MKIIGYALLLVSFCSSAQEPLNDRIFFDNSLMKGSFFYSSASFEQPSYVSNISGRLPVNDSLSFTPGNSLQLKYISAPAGNWTAKLIYRKTRGLDFFRNASHLQMFIYVTDDTNPDELPQVALSTNNSDKSRSIMMGSYVRDYQAGKWLRVKIPLNELLYSRDAGDSVIFSPGQRSNRTHRVLIDQVELIDESKSQVSAKPDLESAKGYEKHVDIRWRAFSDTTVKYIKVYRSEDGAHFTAVGMQSPDMLRYTDFTGETGKSYSYRISFLSRNYEESEPSAIVSASTRPMSDDELLDMVQEANFRYYWEAAEKHSGLALENIGGRRNMIAVGASGFGLMTLITGEARKFITHAELQERFEKILGFLEKADRFHGAFPHFLNGLTGKVESFFGKVDNGADLVETSFLAQGLLTAKQYFQTSSARDQQIAKRIDAIWRAIEWDWFRKDVNSKFLYWHWSPDQGWKINHKLIGWNETMITYVLAISSPTHGIPASFYYSGWASQSEEAQKYRTGWSQTTEGSHYTNGNTYFGIPLKVGVSNGGPLFFVHYSFLGLDPHEMNDAYVNYFENNRNIALINYRYCVENPGDHKGYGPEAWGLTASDGLWNYQADEPVPHQDHGKITPTGALASFPYTPTESMAALKNYYRNYGHFGWGEFGFRDAFNLDENWCSNIYMGLNQGPIAVMIENHRSGLLWKLFMQNKEVKDGLKKITQTPTSTAYRAPRPA